MARAPARGRRRSSGRELGRRAAGARTQIAAAGAAGFARRVRFLEKDTEQYHVCIGGAGIAHDDERRFALRVLEGVLGGTSSSRLFQEVRERRGLAYSVFCFSNLYARTGEVGLYLGTRPENLQRGAVGDRRRARALRGGSRRRGGADPLAREPQGPGGAVAGVHRRAHEPARGLRAERAADSVGRRGDRADRRGRHRRAERARGRAVHARAAVGGRRRPRAGGLPGGDRAARRRLRVRRTWLATTRRGRSPLGRPCDDRRGGRRSGGTHGRDACARRSRAPRTWSSSGAPIRCSARRSRRCSRRAEVVVDFTRPGHRPRQRAGLPARRRARGDRHHGL